MERRLARSGRALPPYRVAISEVLETFFQYLDSEGRGDRFFHSMKHLLEFWQDRTLDALTPGQVRQYVRENTKGVGTKGRSRSTVRRELSDFRAAVNHAIREHIILPVVFPKLPDEGKPRNRWLKPAEFTALFEAAGQEYRSAYTLQLFLMIAYYTGARKGAILDLRWDRVDFDANEIDFRIPDDGGLQQPRKPRAVTPMAPSLREYLLVRYTGYESVPEFVFHQKHDSKRRVRSIDKGFRQAAKEAGLQQVVPHILRHTRVSELLNAGVYPHEVREIMAVSEQTQRRVYGHADQERLQSIARAMG